MTITSADLDAANALHAACYTAIRDMIRESPLPLEQMAVLVLHQDLHDRDEFVARLNQAGMQRTIELVPGTVAILIMRRGTLRQAFDDDSIRGLIDRATGAVVPHVFALPGNRERRFVGMSLGDVPMVAGGSA